jgi:hypothetical protein
VRCVFVFHVFILEAITENALDGIGNELQAQTTMSNKGLEGATNIDFSANSHTRVETKLSHKLGAAWELRERKTGKKHASPSENVPSSSMGTPICILITSRQQQLLRWPVRHRVVFVIITHAKRLVLILNVRLRASKNAVYDKRGR